MVELHDLEAYAQMQRAYYNGVGEADPERIVGAYDYHENFPYETLLLFFNGDIRKPIFPDFADRRAFDIGCGEGRMIRRMRKFFGQVDGADISSSMVAHATARCPGSNIYITNGSNAGEAQSSVYDFVYCTISLQHICVHAARDAILRDIVRILRPDGKITLQLLFSKFYPYLAMAAPARIGDRAIQMFRIDSHHAQWLDNKTNATGTNGRCDVGCDVVIGTEHLNLVRDDLRRKFKSVDLWLYDISLGAGSVRMLPSMHPNSHITDDGYGYWGTHFIFLHCAEPIKA